MYTEFVCGMWIGICIGICIFMCIEEKRVMEVNTKGIQERYVAQSFCENILVLPVLSRKVFRVTGCKSIEGDTRLA